MLVHVARDLDAGLFAEGGGDRTGLGAEWLPWGDITILGDDITCETTYDKNPRELPAVVDQPAFMMFDSLICSTLGISLSALASRLRTNIDDFISAFLTRELITAALSGGIGLQGNVTYAPLITTSTAVSLPIALGNLQTSLNTVQPGARFTIHLTPGLLDTAAGLGLVHEVGNHHETATGHIVIGDPGQLGTDTPQGGSAIAAGQAWIYASGDIYYRTTAATGVTELAEDGGAVYVPQNKNRPLIERKGLLLFDPNVLAAAKVTLAWP
jgi:hypothetical protein